MKKGKKILFSVLCLTIAFSLAISILPSMKVSSATVFVPDDYPTIKSAVNASSSGSISGHVYRSDGATPIIGAMVGVFDCTSPHNYGWVSTSADGSYTFSGLQTGTYAVRVEDYGYSVEWYDGVLDKRQATPVSVDAPSDTSGIDFSLEPGGSILGHVYELNGTTPIERAQIDVYHYNSQLNEWVGYETSWTQSDGSYKTGGLPAGVYAVRVIATGFAVELYDDTHYIFEAELVSVNPPNDTLGINFNLVPGGSVVGHVYRSDGITPIAYAEISVWEYNPQSSQWLHYSGAGTWTNVEGYYVTSGLPTGQYKIRTTAKGYPEEWYDNARDRSQATPVSIIAPNHTHGIDFILEPAITRVWTSETIRGTPIEVFPAGTRRMYINYDYVNPLGSVQKIMWYDSNGNIMGTHTHISENSMGTGTWELHYPNQNAWPLGSFRAELFINDLLLHEIRWDIQPPAHQRISPPFRGKWIPKQPFGNYLTEYNGQTYNGYHGGEDWSFKGNTPLVNIYSISAGKVVKISNLGPLGYLIAIEHAGLFTISGKTETVHGETYQYPSEMVTKIYSVYVHVTPVPGLELNKYVRAGERIATLADINPRHLHFEIRHPNQTPSGNWTLVGRQDNWQVFPGTTEYNGYYKHIQPMVDAGLRDPSEFLDANR